MSIKPTTSLKEYAPWALGLGVLGLLAAAAFWLVQREGTTAVQVSLAIGLLGLALAGLFDPEGAQRWLGGRQARYGGNVLVMTLAMVGIVGVVNYLAVKNPLHWDLTEDKINTLSPETLDALQKLPQPVQAVGFYSLRFSSSARSTAEGLLERYRIESGGKFDFEFHDPEQDPALAAQYNITGDGKLILVMGEQREELTFPTEQDVTGALIRLINPTKRILYFVTGHGEREVEDASNVGLSYVADLLKKQNYEIMPLNLQVTTTVPADARALVIAGPQVPLTAEEVAVLDSYLKAPNSALVVLLDPPLPGLQTQSGPGDPEPLVDYLTSAWGIGVPQNVIVDQNSSLPDQPFVPVSYEYGTSQITQRLQNIATAFPLARSVVVSGTPESHPGVLYTQLVRTSEGAWGETNFDSLTSAGAEQGPDDMAGPLWIGLAADNTNTKSRVVVFGDSDFAGNSLSNRGVHAQLFANSVNWATTEESLINLTPKVPTSRTLQVIDDLTLRLIFFFTVIIMPLSVLAAGGLVWYQRRRHK